MITKEQVIIFNYYKGEGDMFTRLASLADRSILSYKDWSLIEEFLQDVALIESNLVSQSFKDSFQKRLMENLDSEDAILEFKKGLNKLKKV